jgi:OTU-like cysteine protease
MCTIGNCLFRALSDQLYDCTDKHDEIRQTVVEYLRANRDQFAPFVPINTEDWIRSQPSTRSTRSQRASVDVDPYEAYLDNMAKPKTWGGEIEIRAFCEAYDRDVLIHRPTNAGQPFDQMINNKRAQGQPRQFVHVSFGVSGGLRVMLKQEESNFFSGRRKPSALRVGVPHQGD